MRHGVGNSSGLSAVRGVAFALVGLGLVAMASALRAEQIDIAGPAGSVLLGKAVAVLPNGNFVVTDPDAGVPVQRAGAVYLYGPTGNLISRLTGSSVDDHVGSAGVVVLRNGNFVVLSPQWNRGPNARVGAATWVNGGSGLSGTVSIENSLVGTTTDDAVGEAATALSNGNYVVRSSGWHDGAAVGAVTWADGGTGLSGEVSVANSLVNARAASVTALTNGNYVVASIEWQNGSAAYAGAVTWADGSSGRVGVVSAANSLVGTSPGDRVGLNVVALSNGNYVVGSGFWRNGSIPMAGAVTWGSGTAGVSGPVSATNSLVGTTENDAIGRIVALRNGNYVVASPNWSNEALAKVGAVTFVDGGSGLVGPVSAANSLVGTTAYDGVGSGGVTELANGNYVVASPGWNDAATSTRMVGAVTWVDGSTGLIGTVSAGNSLVGTVEQASVGFDGVTALSNGNYVVASSVWYDGAGYQRGAVTWADGRAGLIGTVSAANSLIGKPGDRVGAHGVTALSNGHYVVGSAFWKNGAVDQAGAATWANGTTGLTGEVSAANSLVGTSKFDYVGGTVIALRDGNYVVANSAWNNGAVRRVGAVTWGNGQAGVRGSVSAANSLVGTTADDRLGDGGVVAFDDGNYVVATPAWSSESVQFAGAVTLASGRFRSAGALQAHNSVRGATSGSGYRLVFAYDAAREKLIVVRPADNIISLLTREQVFADAFE
ncbi:MAG: Bifunctional hemolysin/adenylate cyclase precursor [Pseudomonadota bacterium]